MTVMTPLELAMKRGIDTAAAAAAAPAFCICIQPAAAAAVAAAFRAAPLWQSPDGWVRRESRDTVIYDAVEVALQLL